jgi:hypothetical protein
MALALQSTAKNSILLFSCPLILPTPVIIQATGIEDMLSLEDVEGAVMEIGTDGTITSHVKPSGGMVNGTLTLQPLSTALSSIIQVMQRQYQDGVIYYGSLSVTNPSGVWQVAYENVVITTQFKGFELAEKVKDVPIKFSAQVPDSTILGDVISVAAGAFNLL